METLPPGWAGRVTDLGDLVELLTVSALPSEPAQIRTALPFSVEGEPFRVDAVAGEGEIYSHALACYVDAAEGHRAAAAAYRTALEQIAAIVDDIPDADAIATSDGLSEIRGLAAAVLHAVAIP